jgi:hypothetical protein
MTRRSARSLLAAWRKFATGLADGYELGLDDYLNDLDGRRLLAEALATDPRAPAMRPKVEATDALVRAATTPFPVCLWGTANAQRHLYDRQRHWWYFVVPTRRSAAFDDDLKRLQ